jgi:hypothetical protein
MNSINAQEVIYDDHLLTISAAMDEFEGYAHRTADAWRESPTRSLKNSISHRTTVRRSVKPRLFTTLEN